MLILGQNSCILGPTIFKIHNWTDIKVYVVTIFDTFGNTRWKQCFSTCLKLKLDLFLIHQKIIRVFILLFKVRIFWEGHKIWKNLPLKTWGNSVTSIFKWKIFSNFMAFSEYLNFKWPIESIISLRWPCLRGTRIPRPRGWSGWGQLNLLITRASKLAWAITPGFSISGHDFTISVSDKFTRRQ